MFAILSVLSFKTYFTECYPVGISPSECFYVDPSGQSFNNIGIAIFVNTTLFLGGLHQELYNGKIKKKLLKFYKPKFQWDLFNKLFIVFVFKFSRLFAQSSSLGLFQEERLILNSNTPQYLHYFLPSCTQHVRV